MVIVFVHPHKAFLPEIQAYEDFFSRYGIKTLVASPGEIKNIRADVEWHFMGIDLKKNKEVIKIHEYASASVAPFPKAKDWLKKMINCKPDFRIFNNDFVKKQFDFRDGVPGGIRDYGIYRHELLTSPAEKKYDFVYVGTVEKRRKIGPLLEKWATGEFKDHSLLIVSRHYDALREQFKKSSNIFFEGPVPPEQVPSWISQARYGINFIPDELPFNRQTSAKLLDYLNGNLPVISTDYAWVREFQKTYGGDYFFLEKDLSNFTWKAVGEYAYATPDLEEWSWEKQIRKSGVLPFLQSRFSGISF